jgi:PAS domain S-box-containing protein
MNLNSTAGSRSTRVPAGVPAWRRVLGPMTILVAAVSLEALSRTPWWVPDPGVVFLLIVVGSVYLGGIGSGIATAALSLLLGAVFYSLPGPLFHYSDEDMRRLGTLLVATPLVVFMVGVLKRQEELRLREAAHLEVIADYREMVDELDAIVWEREPETGRITFVSLGAEDMLGFSNREMLDTPDFWPRHIHPEDRERTLEQWRALTHRDETGVLEYRMIAADGRVVWLRDALRVVTGRRGRRRVRAMVIDLTDRRRAEEALQSSESRKSAILTSALDAIVDMDGQGRIVEFNPAAERMFGRARADVIGRELAEVIIPPRLRDAHRRGLAHFLATGEGPILGRPIEIEAMRPDGTLFPVELAVIHVHDDGAPAFTGFIRDITQRNQSETALRESEKNYRTLMQEASDGIAITDYDGRFLEANARACEIFGYPREELIQKRINELIAPQDLERVPSRLPELRAGESVMVERWMRRRDGALRAVEISAKRLDPDRIQGIYRDVTERRRAEDRLRETLSVLSATLDATNDGILVVDRQGKITSFNRRFVEMWSIPPDIVESRDDNRALEYVLDQLRDAAGFISKVRELYAHPEDESFDLLEFKDGKIFERYSKPQRIGGESVGRVWSFRDITERRRAEQALRQSEEELRQAQKMEAIGRLAGGVAHDFNNLLTAILGNSSLILDGLGPVDPRRQSAMEIQKAAERAAGLTRQLLAFSRKQMLELKVLDMNEVIVDVEILLRRLVGEHVELVRVPARDLGRVKVDPSQLEQVVLNMVVNARDAMPDGGKLIIETANVQVDYALAERHPPLHPGPYVMLAVSDTGVGMDEDTQRHIFEPFFTTKERGKGTGLGLSTVYGIVRQCEGYVWVYSQPGRGSTFKIYFPRVEGAPEREETVIAPPAVASGTESVLLVEDEEIVRALVRNTLTRHGYRVLEAANGAQALDLAARFTGPIQLLLTDIVMPGLSGPDLAERLTRMRPGLRVLYISGYTEEGLTAHGMPGAGVSFLQKPFTLDALARKVREALDVAVTT